jgi:hypothetical protein
MKRRCAILTLILYIRNGWRARFRDKRRHTCFRDERRIGRRTRFCDKRRRAPRNTHLLYLHNWRRTIGTRVSLLSQKWAHLGYKLNWDVLKKDHLLFTLHRASSAPRWCEHVSFFQIGDGHICVCLRSVSPIWVSYVVVMGVTNYQLSSGDVIILQTILRSQIPLAI